ncbi:MAG: hypothetical protein MUP61_04515 [Burkholderiales bacterium]|nr:hypothetical protein [Burkholderiales bacterium]
MERIIAGRFQTKGDADAAAALIAQFAATADICIFHNNPPGQHDAFTVGGDEDEDPGAEGAGKSAAATAVAAGLSAGAIGALGGPAVALAAGGVGAVSGSLVGAMHGLSNHDDKLPAAKRRPAGIMLSVHITGPTVERRVIDTLRAQGAADIEQAQGEWRDGDWADFDSVAAPLLVEDAPN